VYTLARGNDSHHFFSGAGDGMVVRWDLRTPENGELIARLPNSIYALHRHAAHDLLVVGHNYDGIHLLDWQNKKEIGSLQLTKAAIFDLQALDGDVLVAAGDGTVTQVALPSLTIKGQVQASTQSARTIAVNETRGEVAVGYSDNSIRIFDTALKLKQAWTAHANSVFTLRYSPDGRYLMSGARDARFKVWDADNGYARAGEVVAHLFAINHIDFSPDGKHFVTCSMDKSIKVWDWEALKLLKVIDRARHAGHGTSVNKLLWSNYNQQLISASDDRSISVWNIHFQTQPL